jgi:hypothetical protein
MKDAQLFDSIPDHAKIGLTLKNKFQKTNQVPRKALMKKMLDTKLIEKRMMI